MKRRFSKAAAAVLALCMMWTMAACAPKEKAVSFESFTEQAVHALMQDDYVSIRYFYKDPKAAGFTEMTPTFGHVQAESNETDKELLAQLAKFDRTKLDKNQQMTYDLMQWVLENSIASEGMDYYANPNAPNYGWQAQIQNTLAELELADKTQVEEYLTLLADMPRYVEELLAFQQKKHDAGLGIAPEQAKLAQKECKTFIEAGENNVLIGSFDERIDGLEGLTEEEKTTFKARNREVVQSACIPAYQTLHDGLDKVKDEKNTGGPGSLKEGKAYAALLVKNNTMSDATPEEVLKELEDDMSTKRGQMQILLMKNPQLSKAFEKLDLSTKDAKASLDTLYTDSLADFPALPKTVQYTVSQVPAALVDTIRNPAYYMIPYVDADDVNSIYLNEKYMDNDVLPTLAHEGFPGHMYQENYLRQNGASQLTQLLLPSGYAEGWADYVQRYALKYLIEDEELAKLYAINVSLNYNLMCQMDLGVNCLGWDESELKDFLQKNMNSDMDDASIAEIYQLFLSDPCGYLKYYCNSLAIEQLYEKAEEALGGEMDDKAFHQAILEALPTQKGMQDAVDAYIQSVQGTTDKGEAPLAPAA